MKRLLVILLCIGACAGAFAQDPNVTPSDCSLTIAGSSKVNHYCAAYVVPNDAAACGTFPAPNITLTATGLPTGGTYVWTIVKGDDKAKLVGTPPFTGASVEVQGLKNTDPADKNDVVRVKVEYTTKKGKKCDTPYDLTVREPTSLQMDAPLAKLVVGPPEWGIMREVTYTVLDQYGEAMGAGICVDETMTVCGQSEVVGFTFGDKPTNGSGQVKDTIYRTVPDHSGLPNDTCFKFDQDITAGGCGPLKQNVILIRKTTIAINPGNCAAGSGCP